MKTKKLMIILSCVLILCILIFSVYRKAYDIYDWSDIKIHNVPGKVAFLITVTKDEDSSQPMHWLGTFSTKVKHGITSIHYGNRDVNDGQLLYQRQVVFVKGKEYGVLWLDFEGVWKVMWFPGNAYTPNLNPLSRGGMLEMDLSVDYEQSIVSEKQIKKWGLDSVTELSLYPP